MKAMVLQEVGKPLVFIERADPVPGAGQIRLRSRPARSVERILHVVDGDLPEPKLPLVPGHEIVGIIDAVGAGSIRRESAAASGAVAGHTCGTRPYCRADAENLCDRPQFTGYTRDGGFATHAIADAGFAFDLDPDADPVALAPLLCAGLIGWRSLKKAGDGIRIGLYGFGAAAHIIAQICTWQERDVYAFTRPGDFDAQRFARSLGSVWTGGSDESPPMLLDAAIIFAPVGELVPAALRAVRKGGRVVCGGIHMSDIPSMPYSILWEERELVSVANLTRRDAEEFFPIATAAGVRTQTSRYPLDKANEALEDLRSGKLSGAAVLVP